MNEEEITLHCHWCGRKLVYKRKRINIYDQKTGKPLYHYIYVCPMKWLLLWHDKAVFYRREDGKLEELRLD